ncbi:hypothetical protein L6452_26432 [Arctium lappa]|uniref:Uncharacterized protein n=1 Tax=Arctium lappa TaxID=4217 RepID=A0ACB8ZVP4_ARCLA|nr:hypothetical protein L6452_26432 [Arctium lappa]
MADLEDLSDNDNENLDEDNGDAEHMEEDINRDLADIEVLNYDVLDSVSILIGSTTSLAGGAGTGLLLFLALYLSLNAFHKRKNS